MSSSPPSLAVATCTLALVGSACEQLPEIRYETEHLRIGTSFDEPLCRGDLDHYERVITTLETRLATSVDRPIEVYLWDLTGWTKPEWCTNPEWLGCYSDGVVYADQVSIGHELAHAVIDTFADPKPFWNEGAAEALQSDRTVFDWTTPVDNLELEVPQLDFNTAGHFTRWLLETHGLELYRALLRAPGSAREAFERTYGMTVEAAQEQYFADAPYSYGALIACEHPDLPQTEVLSWSETIDIDCANPHIHGGPLGLGAFRVLTISQRGHYEFTTSAATGVLSRCRDETLEVPITPYGDIPQLLAGDGQTTVLDLAPGRYEIAVGFADHQPRTATLDVRAAPGPIPQTPESTQ